MGMRIGPARPMAALFLAATFTLVTLAVEASDAVVDNAQSNDEDTINVTKKKRDCGLIVACKPGLIVPMWMPQDNLSLGDKLARATVYFTAMVFMFLGVSIISDRFMAAIEVITSKEREVTVRKPDGETTVVNVRVWNETVSNLTLMALGSSAPEILLSVIEVCGNNFEAGDLGPGTIVGSAAFNLFLIIGLCVYVIPDGEVRRIKHLRVFFITASWSIFAYLWMYVIIAVISPWEVEIWEGIVTFLFFPATVVTAYIADRKIFFYKFMSKKYRSGAHKGVIVGTEGEIEMGDKTNHLGDDVLFKGLDSDDAEIREFEKHRKEYIEILREVRKKNPNVDMKSLEEMAEYELMNRGPKSRAFYRIQATRKLTGSGNVIKKSKLDRKSSVHDVKLDLPCDDNITRIYFEPGHYTVMENVGTFSLTVSRCGGNLENTVYVDYRTEDGTANAGSDFEYAEGTVVFHPQESHKQFPVTIIDDDIFEEDEHFYVRLSNIRLGNLHNFSSDEEPKVQLANPSMATVMILDDDHAGIFQFEQPETSFPESVGEANIKVCRSSGARGRVRIPYRSIEGTAKGGGKDFEDADGDVFFDNDSTEGFIKIKVVDDEEYEKNEMFFIELGEPILLKSGQHEHHGIADLIRFGRKNDDDDDVEEVKKDIEDMTEDERIAELGKPRLGEVIRIQCSIRESMEFKNTVDKLLRKANVSLAVGTSSWREQFVEAITVSAGADEDDEDGDGEEKLPSCMDYVMHFLTIFWKVLFAFVPPTDYWGGWAAFVSSIVGIGVMTAFIGDFASYFGCTVGLKSTVVAITFVAVGTSLPDYWGGWASFWVSMMAIGIVTTLIGDIASGFGCTIGLKDSVTAITFVALGTSLPDYWGGWACFCVSLGVTGLLTAVIGDVASGFGCSIGLKDSVTAITFVALGTSLPDTFASKVAAINDQYADSSVGNVTGSNAVNVFLGIGLAWSIAAIYQVSNGRKFTVDPGSLGFSVTIFCCCAFVAVIVMVARRAKIIGGELGGPRRFKILTSLFMVVLWTIYVLLSSLESYCHIDGF